MAQYFKSWIKRKARKRSLICHFYISQSEKQYYDKTDYAYFNLLSSGRGWLVKGTVGHGIKSPRGKTSSVPCLNCFEVNNKFAAALKLLKKDNKFDFGIIFNKRLLKRMFNVVDVKAGFPNKKTPINKRHYYDNPKARVGILSPFNYCDVVRIETPLSDFNNLPIVLIPPKAIVGILVKYGYKGRVKRALMYKKMNQVEVLNIL